MILLILAAVWIVVLAPSAVRRLTGRRGSSSIDSFHHELRLLKRSGPKLIAPAFRLETAFAGGTMARSSTGLPAVSSMPGRPSLVILEPNSQMETSAHRTAEWPAVRSGRRGDDRRGARNRGGTRFDEYGQRDEYGQAEYGQAEYGQAEYGQAEYGQAEYETYDRYDENGQPDEYGLYDGSGRYLGAEDGYEGRSDSGFEGSAYGEYGEDPGAYPARYGDRRGRYGAGRSRRSRSSSRRRRADRSSSRSRPVRRPDDPRAEGRRVRARRRRMNVLALLLVIVVASGVAGLGRSRHMLWGVTGVAGLILVAFVGLSAYARFLTRPARRRPRRSFGRTAPRRSADGSGRYAEEVEPYGQGGEADGWYQQGDRTVEAWDDADTGDGSPQPDGGFWVDDGEIWDEQARTEQIRTEQILYRFDDVQGRDDEGEGWEPIAAAR